MLNKNSCKQPEKIFLSQAYEVLDSSGTLPPGPPETYTSVRDLVITVVDVNDRPPAFDRPLYDVKVAENSHGVLPGVNITVTDLDQVGKKMYSQEKIILKKYK